MKLQQNVVMKLKGYSLLSVEYLRFQKGDYILLNDPVNTLGEGILDVFIMQIPGKPFTGNFITIVDEEGNSDGYIPYANDTMFMVHRGTKNYYIDLV